MTHDDLKAFAGTLDRPARAREVLGAKIVELAQGYLALSVKLEETETLLSDQTAYTQDFMRQVRGLQAKLEGATARSRLVEERVAQCIDASWHGTNPIADPSLVLQEYIDHLQVKLEEAQAERDRFRVERDEARELFEWSVDRGDVVFSNHDYVMHLPRPDCQKASPHLIDACGAFEPQPFEREASPGEIVKASRGFTWVNPSKPELDVHMSVNQALHAVDSPWRIDIHETGQAIAVPTPETISFAMGRDDQGGEIVKACPQCGAHQGQRKTEDRPTPWWCTYCDNEYDEPVVYQIVKGPQG